MCGTKGVSRSIIMTIIRTCTEILPSDNNYEKLLGVTRSVFQSGRTKPLKFRANALRGLLQLFRECHEELTEALKKDLRKNELEGTGFKILKTFLGSGKMLNLNSKFQLQPSSWTL